jgi:hypothetical protein
MTVKELTNLLKQLPPDIKIVVRGYEEGYNDILQLKPLKLIQDINAKWYYGEYSKSDSEDVIDAVELYGENKNEERK